MCGSVFRLKRAVKNTIFTYKFPYTQLSDICKCLKANGDCSVQSSHNPLVLGSNPSGPSLPPEVFQIMEQ